MLYRPGNHEVHILKEPAAQRLMGWEHFGSNFFHFVIQSFKNTFKEPPITLINGGKIAKKKKKD